MPRFDLKFIVHQDRYHRFSPDELNQIFLPFGQESFKYKEYQNKALNAVQANYIRKFTADFSLEMNRSVRAMLKHWCEE